MEEGKNDPESVINIRLFTYSISLSPIFHFLHVKHKSVKSCILLLLQSFIVLNYSLYFLIAGQLYCSQLFSLLGQGF
jgi:hypothetical protein